MPKPVDKDFLFNQIFETPLAKEVKSKKGWVNDELKGILQIGEKRIVVNVSRFAHGYIWIEF